MKWQLRVLYATVFINLLGFSIVIAMRPYCGAMYLALHFDICQLGTMTAALVLLVLATAALFCVQNESQTKVPPKSPLTPLGLGDLESSLVTSVDLKMPLIRIGEHSPENRSIFLFGARSQPHQDFRQRSVGLTDAEEMMSRIANIAISIAVSDPSLDGTPIIAHSPGFTLLTGYSSEEILGGNCLFLTEGVPPDMIFESEQEKARDFIQACQKVASLEKLSLPGPYPEDCISVQRNRRKDGTLFDNMFLLHLMRFNGKAYVVGLQEELDTVGDETNPVLWQTSVHLKASLKMAIARLTIDSNGRAQSLVPELP